jgi:pullulanase/glycogen debranching enzyme
VQRGLPNYGGYDAIGFLAPHHRYAARGSRGRQVPEFTAIVRTLHEAGMRWSSTSSTTTPPRATTWADALPG